jgi:hypothetical protein
LQGWHVETALNFSVRIIPNYTAAEPVSAPNESFRVDSKAVGNAFGKRNLSEDTPVAKTSVCALPIIGIDAAHCRIDKVKRPQIWRESEAIRELEPFVYDVNRTVIIDTKQATHVFDEFFLLISEIGAGVNAALGVSNAVVHDAFVTVDLVSEKSRFRLPVPEPDSGYVRDYKSAVSVESVTGDLHPLTHDFGAAIRPDVSVESAPCEIGPIERLFVFVPKRSFATKVLIIGDYIELLHDPPLVQPT